jgi:hypothetical protein
MRINQTSKLLIVAAMVLGLVWGTAPVVSAATGDDCTDPIVINLPGDLPFSDIGQTNCGRLDDYDATCLGYYDSGEDIIYELVVSSAVDLDITLDPKTTTYSGIGLDDGCPFDASTCLYTSTNSSAAPHGIAGAHLEPGTYYIMIDTWSTPDCIPEFDLTITAAAGPDPGDNCTLPIVVNLPGDSPYTDAGQTNCGRNNDYSATCLGSYDGGEDIIYELNLSTTLEVDVTLDPKTTTWTGIVLDDTCPADAADCIATSTNSGASPHGFQDVLLGPGTYYIMIDTYPSPNCVPDFDLTIVATAPGADDMQTVSIDNPSAGAAFEGGSAVSVQATVKNKGSNPQSGVEVHLEIDDGAGYNYTDVEYTGALNQNDTEVITFAPDWTVPDVNASYSLTIWTALAGDNDVSNDTLSIGVSSFPQGYSVESFEDATFPPEGWYRTSTDWARTSGSAHSGSYKAYARGQNAWLMTPQLDVGAGDVLKYWYRSESASYATSFMVRLSTSADQTDTSAYTTVLADHPMITSTTYTEGVIDLSPYAARLKKGQIYIAFHRYYGDADYYYLFLDDVMLPPIYVPPGDMATISIDNPSDGAALQGNSAVSVQATVQNVGGDPQSGVAVHLEIDDGLGYTYTDVENTGTLNSGETEQITFDPDWTVPNANASYAVKVWTELSGDFDPSNDTVSIGVSSVLEGYSAESFENTTFPPSGWIAHDFDGGGGWSRSTSYAHSGGASAYCSYDLPNNDWLITPPLKIKAGTDDVFKFWVRTASSASYPEDYMVRLSTTGTDTSDFSTILLSETQVIYYPDFVEKELDLDAYDGQTVYIAFYLYSYDELGLYIDDVLLPPIPTQIAVSPTDFDWESFPDSFFDVYMYIGNVGGGQLDYSIELETAVGWLSVDPTSGSALGGEQDTITLSVNTTGLDGHYYNTIRVISNSGEKQDGDTVFVPVHLWVRLIPDIDVDPDSFAVEVPGNGTVDDNMYIHSVGSGPLDYEIATEEYGKDGAKFMGQPPHHDPSQRLSKPSNKEVEKDQRDYNRGVPPTKGLGGPDAFGYKWIDSDEPGGPTFNWVEINTTGTPVDVADDGNVGPFDIGFTFEYYGVEFTQFRIASNGFVSFTSTSGTLSNTYIPYTDEPNNLLALMWDDMRPASGGGSGTIYYHSDGSRLVIEWDHVMRYGTTYYYTMQIILYPNGKIVYQYLTMDGDRLDESTVGIENGDGTDGLEVVYNADYMHNDLAIRFSAAPAWIVYDPESGSVPPGETDTIDVTFDATGILGGDFYGAFLISSNAEKALDTVPAHMTVLAPDMTVSPDSIVSTGTEGAVHHEYVTLGNTGAGDLLWSIDESIDWLSASPSSGTVPSGGGPTSVDLTIDCSSVYAGDYYGELTINNNDPDLYPSITYKVFLHVGPDPSIETDPDSFYVEVYAGTYRDSTLRLTNDGAGHLVFDIEVEESGIKQGLVEGFEDAWPPTGWSIIQTHATSYWMQYDATGYPDYVHSGNYAAGVWWNYGHQDEWLISPPVGISGTCSLTFWTYGYQGSPYGDHYNVKVSTDGGSNWNTELDLSTLPDLGDFNMYDFPYTIDLSGYSGQTVNIAFHAEDPPDNDGLWWVWFVDDVELTCFGGGWLTVNPEEGVVDPSTYTDLNVRFDASEILGGEKFGNIIINHNVPEVKGQTLVPVHMVILGPEYSIDPTSLTISATEGATTDDYLTVGNYTGDAPLIYQMSDDVDWLSESPSSETVPAGNDQVVTVTVDGNLLIPGDYYAEIYVHTNDFDETYDTIPVNVHVGPDPILRVKPTSFIVDMFPGTMKDSIMTLVNDGDGTLSWEISIEYTNPMGAPLRPDVYDFLKEYEARSGAAPSGAGSVDPLVDMSSPMGLTRSVSGDATGPALSPLVGKGDDTLFVQLPHNPDESWSFGTTDQGAGYKMYENFWGLTEQITEIDFWGLAMIYSGGWYQGNPANLVFDITFYSDPPDDPTLPPTEVYCTYTDVVPSQIISTGLSYSGFMMYFFDGAEFGSSCDLTEGWVSIQSKSAGEGYDWLLWASAQTGDGFSYQENGTNPRYYDQAMIITGGGGGAWLTVAPESGLTSPHDSTDVDVTFDATNLDGGTWFADIIIDHNAPGKGQTIVPVRLHLLGANFAMTPESLVVDMLEGQLVNEHLYLSNPGGEGDLIFSMTDPADWLSEHPDAGAVMPEGEEDVIVRIDGADMIAGHYYTEITITTNDFDNQEVIVPVHVNVGPDPDIDVDPAYAAGVVPGCQYSLPMEIRNEGEGHLGFNVAVAQEPPMFTTGRTGVHDALEALRQAGSGNPDITPEAAYRTVGAERSTIQRSSGVSDGLLLMANAGKTADILLVDDDGGLPGGTYYDVELIYTAALDAGGYVYDYYVVDWTDPLSSGPDLTTMQAYKAVIWFCGETWGYYGLDVLTPTDEANLGAYLSGGGNFFLSAQDWLWASYPSAGSFSPGQFPYDYLHLASVNQDVINDPYTCTGLAGSVAEGMSFQTLRFTDNPDVPLWTDYLTTQSSAAVDVFDAAGGVSAIQYDSGTWRVVFTTTPFPGLVDGSPSTRAEFMGSVVDWLLGAGCPFTVTPETGVVDPESFGYVTLTFDGEAFAECADETLSCYLVITSNDPDEPQKTVEVSMWPGRGDVFDPFCLIELGDVVYLINYVLKGGPAPDPLCMGDCDPSHDGTVDLADVVYLVQFLYQGGMPPLAIPEARQPSTIKQLSPKAPAPTPRKLK